MEHSVFVSGVNQDAFWHAPNIDLMEIRKGKPPKDLVLILLNVRKDELFLCSCCQKLSEANKQIALSERDEETLQINYCRPV